MRKLLALSPAGALGVAHLFIHFSVPILDLAMHGALVLALILGARSNA